ncbi:hypothetical protein KP509_16G003000 [Ceratopteris richardii]|uniref:Uncharacterized protein n=1 Tax=Ceratopteris richardii TaxID=49495 RepID=A0A8T2SWC6_CERRI|nr:hypothetical protein KP509_16G003000 [Ceratopteris richardii]
MGVSNMDEALNASKAALQPFLIRAWTPIFPHVYPPFHLFQISTKIKLQSAAIATFSMAVLIKISIICIQTGPNFIDDSNILEPYVAATISPLFLCRFAPYCYVSLVADP